MAHLFTLRHLGEELRNTILLLGGATVRVFSFRSSIGVFSFVHSGFQRPGNIKVGVQSNLWQQDIYWTEVNSNNGCEVSQLKDNSTSRDTSTMKAEDFTYLRSAFQGWGAQYRSQDCPSPAEKTHCSALASLYNRLGLLAHHRRHRLIDVFPAQRRFLPHHLRQQMRRAGGASVFVQASMLAAPAPFYQGVQKLVLQHPASQGSPPPASWTGLQTLTLPHSQTWHRRHPSITKSTNQITRHTDLTTSY